MSTRIFFSTICLFVFLSLFSPSKASPINFHNQPSDDWPQWLGPDRNGVSKETGLLQSWPDGGPRVLWRAPLGEGYSGISISNGLAYTLFADANSEFAICLEAISGKKVWQFRIDDKFFNSWGNGPRMAPTVDGERVYVISAKARLFALHAQTGTVLWQHDLAMRFGGMRPDLGYSNSPIVIDSLLLVTVGGHSNRAVVALDKITGELVWAAHSDHNGYSSPIAIEAAGAKQIIFFTGTKIASLAPATGKIYWTYPWRTSSYENVATPVFLPQNKLFFSSPHPKDKGSAVLQINKNSNGLQAEIVWKNNIMKNHFSTSVLRGNYLYGTDRAILKCVDSRTGEQMWQARGYGEGTLILADGHLIVLGTYGKLALVEATETAYRKKASAQVLSGKCYTVPSLANGRLYLRNQREMVCLDLRKK